MARLNNITIACEEPVQLAELWREALGYEHVETPSEVLAEVERLAGLGATVVEERSQKIGPYEELWTVMRDPEGNGFCVS